MTAAKRQARQAAITALDEARLALVRYLDCFATAEETVALVGTVPDLEALRYRFENATAPDNSTATPQGAAALPGKELP